MPFGAFAGAAGGTGGASNPFADALEKLGKTTDNLAKAVESFERLSRDAWKGAAWAGGGGGGGDRAATPHAEPRGLFRRAFDATRFGESFAANRGTAGKLLGGTGASGMGGLSGGAAGLARAAGVAGVIVAAGEALNQMRKRIEEWTTAAVESKRKMADAGSGAMANIFAQRHVQEMFRDRQMGDRLAPSTRQLVESEQRRKDAAAPLVAAVSELENRLLTFLNDKLGELYGAVREGVNFVVKKAGGPDELIPGMKKDEASDAFAAITGPGGVIEMADAIEKNAKELLDKAKKGRDRFGMAARPPGRLP